MVIIRDGKIINQLKDGASELVVSIINASEGKIGIVDPQTNEVLEHDFIEDDMLDHVPNCAILSNKIWYNRLMERYLPFKGEEEPEKPKGKRNGVAKST